MQISTIRIKPQAEKQAQLIVEEAPVFNLKVKSALDALIGLRK